MVGSEGLQIGWDKKMKRKISEEELEALYWNSLELHLYWCKQEENKKVTS